MIQETELLLELAVDHQNRLSTQEFFLGLIKASQYGLSGFQHLLLAKLVP